jgi:hypothetical protein
MSRQVSFAGLCLLSLLGLADAQVLTGNIIGTVKDESGAVLPGVSVTILSPTALPGGPRTVVTNETGEYRFTELTPGSYALTITIQGFSTYQEEGLVVAVGGTTERNVSLKMAAVAETITVTGASPMIDSRKVGVTTNLDVQVLESIPIKRNTMLEYAKWAPGVAAQDPSGSGNNGSVAVMGSDTSENSILFDGVMTNHPASGGYWASGDMDGMEEVQLVTLGASPEYHVAQGGVINAVFKTGTNLFKADARADWHPDGLVSKPIQLACNCAVRTTGFTTEGYRDLSGHVGGPIVQDRLWFFAGGNYYTRTQSNPGIDPSLPLERYSHRILGKVNWQPNQRIQLKQTFTFFRWWNPGLPTLSQPFATQTASGGPSLPMYSSELTATLTPNTLLTARATGWWDNGYNNAWPLSGNTTASYHLNEITSAACCGVQSFSKEDASRLGQAVKLNRYIQGRAADHNVAVGLQLEESHDYTYGAYPNGVYYSDLGSAPDQATVRSPFVSAANSTSQSVWGQDQITLAGRVTLDLGGRFDRMHAVSPAAPAVGDQLKPTGASVAGLGDMFTWNVWSPRLGFNYKLTGDGKTTAHGNYGRAYRTIFLNDFELVHPGLSPITLARWNPATSSYSTILSVTNPIANIAVDRNIKAPFTDQSSIGIDRQLATSLGVSATYVHKSGQNNIGWEDIGGVYGTEVVTLPDGRAVTVDPLLNKASSRLFLRTNGPGAYMTYNGMLLTMTKRMSQRWQANVAYTYSHATGLLTSQQDPNGNVNAAGRLALDRPQMVEINAMYHVPKIGLVIAPNYLGVSGTPYSPQALISLPQGRISVNIAPPGTYRLPSQNLLFLRMSKTVFQRGDRRLELMAYLTNAFQNGAFTSVVSQNFYGATFGQPNAWVEPRTLYFSARVQF